MIRGSALLIFAAVLLQQPVQARDACMPVALARLDGRVSDSGIVFVPATFGARQTELAVVTGGWSELVPEIVSELGLRRTRVLKSKRLRGVAGDESTHSVRVPAFDLGGYTVRDAPFFVMAIGPELKGGGVLGADNLSKFDIEIDGPTVTLFKSSFSCATKPVGWDESWREIPFVLVDDIPDLKVTANGHEIDTTLQTGASHTLMNLRTARTVFGITPETPGVRRLRDQAVEGGNSLPLYVYVFPVLDLSGFQFRNARVVMGDFLDTTLSLGMREVSQLRIHIAYQQHVLYATWRDQARRAELKGR